MNQILNVHGKSTTPDIMLIKTCEGPINIAVVKYWGKRNDELILPMNDSLSVTLHVDHIRSKTTIACSPSFEEDSFWLNGKSFPINDRMRTCIEEAKKYASEEREEATKWKLRICSENNFATAAGLASSAAGFACLVYCLAQVYGLGLLTDLDLTIVARRGSGSACRSIYGGFVWWQAGERDDGADSRAVQVAAESRWPDLRAVVLVVSHAEKDVSSKDGMKRSRETSELLHFRAKNIVPRRIEEMIKAIRTEDFDGFAELTMKDSNQFHAVALDTFPPCFYMNDVSRNIVDLVNKYNAWKAENGSSSKYAAAYTFDAGPNACIYIRERDLPEFVSIALTSFPPRAEQKDYLRGLPVEVKTDVNSTFQTHSPGQLDYVICTKPGPGPRLVENSHLLDEKGNPKNLM